MSKFKVGDRVRAIEGTSLLKVGEEYTINRMSIAGDPIVEVTSSSSEPLLLDYPDHYFELVITPAEPTDAELAAEYRKALLKMRATRKELEDRGFNLFIGLHRAAGINMTLVENYKFKKTVTTTEEI